MHQPVGQRQITESILINIGTKVFFTRVELSIAVMVVGHRGHAVETESVEMELIHPILDIGEQKMAHLILSVIEKFGSPVGMISCGSGRRIEAIGAVQFIDSLVDIFDIVGMHQIHHHGKTHFVSRSDQRLQLFGVPNLDEGAKKLLTW